MRLLHIHWPRTSERRGRHAAQECRCGARRSLRTGAGYSPVKPGWPSVYDGWLMPTLAQQEAEAGLPQPPTPPAPVPPRGRGAVGGHPSSDRQVSDLPPPPGVPGNGGSRGGPASGLGIVVPGVTFHMSDARPGVVPGTGGSVPGGGGSEARQVRPRMPDPGKNTRGEVACNVPLYDFNGVVPVAYCSRYVKPGKSHRGKHRIEWS